MPTPPRFLDTNILLRYLTRDDPARAAAALALLTRVERGQERVVTSPLVIFETILTLQKRYRFPKEDIRQALTDLISMRGLQLPGKALWMEALSLFAAQNIPFVDAYNVAYMRSRGLGEIYSWDGDFDKIAVLTRVEP
jgi:predicted nucleic acid-binding protein